MDAGKTPERGFQNLYHFQVENHIELYMQLQNGAPEITKTRLESGWGIKA